MKHFLCATIVLLSVALPSRNGWAQWVQTNGPYGASVYCIQPFGNNIFIGTKSGVFESTDQGSNWRKRSSGLPNTYVYSLTTRGSILFAGTLEHGVYRSTDSGATWISASSGLTRITSIRTLGSNSHTLFAPEGYYYFYISTDDGNQWTQEDTNLTILSSPQTILTVDSITYAAGSWITQTTDDGKTWAVISVPPADTFWDIYSMANIGRVLFVVDREFGVMRSENHGEFWDHVKNGLPAQAGILFLATISSNLFGGGYGGVYCSSDSGNSWQLASSGLPSGVEVSALASSGTELFAGFYGLGMFRSLDSGRTWIECNKGLVNSKISAITSMGDTTFVGTNAGLFRSTDNGSSWLSKQDGFSDFNITSFLRDGENLYAGGQKLYLSTDRGENWSVPDSGLTESGIDGIIRR